MNEISFETILIPTWTLEKPFCHKQNRVPLRIAKMSRPERLLSHLESLLFNYITELILT